MKFNNIIQNKKYFLVITFFIVIGIVAFLTYYLNVNNVAIKFLEKDRVILLDDQLSLDHIDPYDQNFTPVELADGLWMPLSMIFITEDKMLVIQRSGEVVEVALEAETEPETIYVVEDVFSRAEGGLMGITTHPNFSENGYIYLYYTYESKGRDTYNKVVRYTYQNKNLSERKVVVDQIKGSLVYNGGQLAFGPDGYLYISTGDDPRLSQAQDPSSLAGKILRVTDEGKPALNNINNSLIYSYGHLNPRGLVWDDKNQLWAIEQGIGGSSSVFDELNLINNGANYGWPLAKGDEIRIGLTPPEVHSGEEISWTPSGLAQRENSWFFGSISNSGIHRIKYQNGQYSMAKFFEKELGYLSDIKIGEDGNLYVLTHNMIRRGQSSFMSDKVWKINMEYFDEVDNIE